MAQMTSSLLGFDMNTNEKPFAIDPKRSSANSDEVEPVQNSSMPCMPKMLDTCCVVVITCISKSSSTIKVLYSFHHQW